MFYWSGFPFVRVVLFFILGILAGIYLPLPAAPIGLLLGLPVVALIVLLAKRGSWQLRYNFLYGMALSWVFLALGMVFLLQRTETRQPNHLLHLPSANYYVARVVSGPEVKGGYLRLRLQVEAIAADGWRPATGRVLAYFRLPLRQSPAYNDRLLIKGAPFEVTPPRNPREFDYRQYLAFNNIHHQQFVAQDAWLRVPGQQRFDVIGASIRVRNYLAAVLGENIHGAEELAIAKALILGDKGDLGKPVREVYAMAGAMHVLAVSGLHVGIIYVVLLMLLGQKQGKVKKPGLVAVVVIPTLWLYAFVTGLSPSVLRAVTMFSFLALAQVFNRRSHTLNTLAISAFILLLINPYMIMAVGFQLSYVAVVGIIFLYPVVERWFNPGNRILRLVWQITALSLAAQLATSPLSALYFHRFPTYFLFSNLLVIPAATLIVWGGLGLLCLGAFSSLLATAMGKLLGGLIGLLNRFLHWISLLPMADIHNLAPTIADTWLVYGLLVFAFLYLTAGKVMYFRLATALTVVLCLNLFYAGYRSRHLRQMVFYSINRGWAVDLVAGRRFVSFADTALLANREKRAFLVTPYRRFYGLKPALARPVRQQVAGLGEIIAWQGKTLLLANPCLKPTEMPPYFDFVLFRAGQSAAKCYQDQILLRKFVSDEGVRYQVHNLRTEGALIVDL